MALVKCSECDKEISDKAETCPSCGSPTKVKKAKSGQAFAIFTLLFTVMAALMPMIISQGLLPLAIVFSLVTLYKRRFVIGGLCLLVSVVGFMSVLDTQERLHKSVEDLKNIGKQ